MKTIIYLILLVIAYFVVIKPIFNWIKPQSWQGNFYPNGDTLVDMTSPVFATKDQCLEWATNLKNQRNNPNDDFECGLNCRREPGRLVSTCEETTDH